MAKRKPTLAVHVTFDASDDLNEIYRYNAHDKGDRQAYLWDSFLRGKIKGLGRAYDEGRPVSNSPELRYITARKHPKAHGHVIVYEVDTGGKAVHVLRMFHTRQDWENKL